MSHTIALISLGCAKNLVDSERMLALLTAAGFTPVEEEEKAEVLVINTCGFIESAKRESIDAIIAAAARKQQGVCRLLCVTGCLVERYPEELAAEIPEVDIWLGTLNFTEIADRVQALLPNAAPPRPAELRLLTTPPHRAYLKIAEGCNNRCAFCAIPQMRGPYVSRPPQEIVAEAQFLIAQGVREIDLLAEDTTYYGVDLEGRPLLPELLRELVKLDVLWLRLFYSYGQRLSDELIELLAAEPKLCAYLDIPMQHAADPVLKRMGRPERHDELLSLVKRIRAADPDFVIRSTFIVGFPGETEADVDTLCDFLEQAALDWVGVFTYSQEDGTAAAAMDGQIDEETKEARYHRVMALLSRLSADHMERWIGRTVPVLIEQTEPLYGRTAFQGPEVDGVTYLHGAGCYAVGELVQARITAADVYDLIGEIL